MHSSNFQKQLCPCDSGRSADSCCWDCGRWNKIPTGLGIAGPRTGFANPRCYASEFNDCKNQITREHYISAAVLDLIDNKALEVTGMSWQEPGTSKVISTNSLVANVLCERHNLSLSPLDKEFARFVRTIKRYKKEQNDSTVVPTEELKLFNGEDIENWMIKTLAGIVFSNNMTANGLRNGTLEILFNREKFPTGGGLYIENSPDPITETTNFTIQIMHNLDDKIVRACKFGICTLPFMLVLGEPKEKIRTATFRPRTIAFESNGISKSIEMSWTGDSGEVVRYNRQAEPKRKKI